MEVTDMSSRKPGTFLARAKANICAFMSIEDALEILGDPPLGRGELSVSSLGSTLCGLVLVDLGLTLEAIETDNVEGLHLEALRADVARLNEDAERAGIVAGYGLATLITLVLDDIEAAA
jgi:hypothetical protein